MEYFSKRQIQFNASFPKRKKKRKKFTSCFSRFLERVSTKVSIPLIQEHRKTVPIRKDRVARSKGREREGRGSRVELVISIQFNPRDRTPPRKKERKTNRLSRLCSNIHSVNNHPDSFRRVLPKRVIQKLRVKRRETIVRRATGNGGRRKRRERKKERKKGKTGGKNREPGQGVVEEEEGGRGGQKKRKRNRQCA